jgi:CRISPR-associated protein Cas5t
MQALRLRLHQHSAVYRNPSSGEIVESYPLVPPSTVLGLISSVLTEKELDNSFNLSIQGNHGALIRDYQWHKKYDKEIGSYQDHRYPLLIHTLYDINLLLHIFSSNQSSLDMLFRKFRSPPYFLYLGRAEDIIKIDEVKIVNVQKQKLMDSYHLAYDAYIRPEDCKAMRIGGIKYHLTSYCRFVPWTIGKQTTVIRDFDWTEVYYVEKGARIEVDNDSDLECWSDGENLVWWSLPNQLL